MCYENPSSSELIKSYLNLDNPITELINSIKEGYVLDFSSIIINT